MIALSVGHSRRINGRYDGGAYSPHLGKNERDFNMEVATYTHSLLESAGVESRIVSEYAGRGYTTAMMDAARQIEAMGATLAVEFHFNSATPSANGHEWLYWHSSKGGKKLAQAFHDRFTQDFPTIKARGVKPLNSSSRGAQFVRLTHCPAIILEPFFGSNESDCRTITARCLASAYTGAILNYLRNA